MADLLETARRLWHRARGLESDAESDAESDGEEGQRRTLDILLVVAVVLGLVWLGQEFLSQESGSKADRGQRSKAVDSRPAPGPQAGVKVSTGIRSDRCEEVYAAQVRPLRAVTPAMTQWEVHIGAMNQLVVGAISLAQATSFWNETREGAERNLAEFGDAMRGFGQRTARCPKPLNRSQASDGLGACAEVIAARHRALSRAEEALDTWDVHVQHMEMLRRGQMTPEEATRLWLESWREGDRQVDAYRSAAREAQRVAGSPEPCTG